MDLKSGIELGGFAILVLTNLVLIVAAFTGIRKDVGFLKTLHASFVEETTREIVRLDNHHQKHFDHAANTGIHQESMSKESIGLHFRGIEETVKSLGEQIRTHAEEDRGSFRDIEQDLKEISGRLPALGKG